MSRSDEIYRPALDGKKIPVLTLDHTWHKLFTRAFLTPEIESLQSELNELLKQQGKANTEQKSVRNLKKKLMDEIVQLRSDSESSSASDRTEKKIDELTRLVEECNEKIDELRDQAMDLPREINRVNYELMLRSMEVCYDRLGTNMEEIEGYDKWIREIRIELKKNLIRKQELEADTYALYSYMHDIFGPEVINIFDMHYHPEQYAPKPKIKDENADNDAAPKP